MPCRNYFIKRRVVDKLAQEAKTTVSSASREVTIARSMPTTIIGERINPTGRKVLQKELKEGIFDTVRQDALAQVEAGAAILDVNAGVPGMDEVVLLVDLIKVIREVTDVPLCIDTANFKALEAALKAYDGKALVNSVNAEEEKLRNILPLIAEYGAAVIGLTLDDEGIPKTVDKRLFLAEKIIKRAEKAGVSIENIIIDPLALSMGTEEDAGLIVTKSIEEIVKQFGVNVTLGASNISFGLPDRPSINATFMAMAIHSGLTCPITNPLEELVKKAILAADLCKGTDQNARNWLAAYRKSKKAGRV